MIFAIIFNRLEFFAIINFKARKKLMRLKIKKKIKKTNLIKFVRWTENYLIEEHKEGKKSTPSEKKYEEEFEKVSETLLSMACHHILSLAGPINVLTILVQSGMSNKILNRNLGFFPIKSQKSPWEIKLIFQRGNFLLKISFFTISNKFLTFFCLLLS